MMNLDRITQNPLVMGGKACVRGKRVMLAWLWGRSVRATPLTKSSLIIRVWNEWLNSLSPEAA